MEGPTSPSGRHWQSYCLIQFHIYDRKFVRATDTVNIVFKKSFK